MENTSITIQDKQPLIFTDSAAEKVKKLIEEEKILISICVYSLPVAAVLDSSMDSLLMKKFKMVTLKYLNVA